MEDGAVLASGLGFPESPEVSPEGQLYFVDCDRSHIGVVRGDRSTGHIDTGAGSMPAGIAFDHEGKIVMCDAGYGQIRRIDPVTGESFLLADGWDADDGYAVAELAGALRDTVCSRALRGPNDLVLARDGTVYFTDPKGSDPDRPIGAVYRLDRGGKVTRLCCGLAFPNGILLSPDERTLFVAETYPKHIVALTLAADGKVESHRIFYRLEGAGTGPDGMCYDDRNRMMIAYYGGGALDIVSLQGEKRGAVAMPGARPTNVCFAQELFGNQGRYAVVTEADSKCLLAFDLDRREANR